MSIYTTVILSSDGDDRDPVLMVGRIADEAYVTVGVMRDGESKFLFKALAPQVAVHVSDLLTALGYFERPDEDGEEGHVPNVGEPPTILRVTFDPTLVTPEFLADHVLEVEGVDEVEVKND